MKKRGFVFAAAVVAVALAVGGFVLFTISALKQRRQADTVSATYHSVTSDDEIGVITYNGSKYQYNRDLKNILFLGVDKQAEMVTTDYVGKGGQSDSILILSIDTKNNRVKMLSIPREVMVGVDLYDLNGEYLTTQKLQLCLQYAFGDGTKKSCRLTKEKVSTLLGDLPIDSVISMDVTGISTVADLLGGITVVVPDDFTAIDQSFVKGKTITLKREMAEKYVRSRNLSVAGSNLGRIQRQISFIGALTDRMANNTDSNAVDRVLSAVDPYMYTDMTADQMKQLATYSFDKDIEVLPGEMSSGITAGEQHDEYYADEEDVKKLITDWFYLKQ